MILHLDIFQFGAFLIVLGTIFGALYYVRAISKKTYLEVVERTSQGWKELSEQKVAEVKELTDRVKALEQERIGMREDMRQIREEHDTVIRLNIGLQEANDVLKKNLQDREDTIRQLRAKLDERNAAYKA